MCWRGQGIVAKSPKCIGLPVDGLVAESPVATAPRVAMPPKKFTVFRFARSNYLWRLLKYLLWQTMM